LEAYHTIDPLEWKQINRKDLSTKLLIDNFTRSERPSTRSCPQIKNKTGWSDEMMLLLDFI
jgi:hypothetical protein